MKYILILLLTLNASFAWAEGQNKQMKPTLVFLHGGPGFRDYLKHYFSDLEPRFKCIFFDQVRGPKVTIDDQLRQLETIVRAEKNKVVLVGHSWGGVLATEYVLRYPLQISGLVLISTGLKASQWKDEYRKELKNLKLEDASPAEIFLSEEEIEKGKPLLEATEKGFSSETFDSLNTTYLKDYDVTAKFSGIRIPILNFFGERDIRFPVRVTRSFRGLNQEVEDVEIAGAGHFPFLLERNRKRMLGRIAKKFDN